ncbi:MAG: GTP-binding protein [Asgard group archaeon]|nr:GTP-binding protein [Asgard group archaeon]
MEPIVKTTFPSREEKLNVIKIVLVGDTKVGKTTLIEAFTGKGIAERGYSASLEIPVKIKGSNYPTIGRIYDLRSQRYFPYLHSLFYFGAKGAIIVFDVNDKNSFNSITKWRDIIWGHTGNIPLLLCGNKSDLRQTNEDQITKKEIEQLIQELSKKQGYPVSYIEISALKYLVAFTSGIKETENGEIYPTVSAFRKPFIDWIIQIVEKGKV